MAKKNQFTIRGKVYDLDDAADLVSVQNVLVPENWVGKKADAVRLFLALQNMLGMQIKRHLAANFKGLIKAALEEGEEGGEAKISAGFAFEINVTAPQVAALTKLKMSYSVKHGTEGKPQTHDLTQGEFLDDDMTVVFDTKALETEKKDAAEEEKRKKEEEDADKGDSIPDSGAGGDVTAENTPGTEAPASKKPKKKKK